MSTVGYFTDLRHTGILLLLLVGSMGNRPWHGVVVLAGDNQQRSTFGILGVDLGFRPRVEIGTGRLEDRHTGAGYRVRLVQLVRFALVYGVGEGEAELLVGQRDGAGVVEGIAQHRRGRLECRERQGQHAAERRGIDGDRHGSHALPSHLLRDEPAEGMADDGGLRLELADGVDVVIGDLLDALVGEDLRVVLGLLNGVRVIGPAWRERGVALLFKEARQLSQLLERSQRPWTKTTGCLPCVLARSISCCSWIVRTVMSNTPLGVSVGSIGEIVPFNVSRSSRLAYASRVENPSRSQAVARAIAPRVAVLFARAFNMTKS